MSKDLVFNMYEGGDVRDIMSGGGMARVFHGKNVTVSIIHMEPNSDAVLHSHENEQWGFLVEGEMVEIIDGVEHHVKVGDFWYLPPNVEHGGKTGDSGCVIIDIFSPPRPGQLPDELAAQDSGSSNDDGESHD